MIVAVPSGGGGSKMILGLAAGTANNLYLTSVRELLAMRRDEAILLMWCNMGTNVWHIVSGETLLTSAELRALRKHIDATLVSKCDPARLHWHHVVFDGEELASARGRGAWVCVWRWVAGGGGGGAGGGGGSGWRWRCS